MGVREPPHQAPRLVVGVEVEAGLEAVKRLEQPAERHEDSETRVPHAQVAPDEGVDCFDVGAHSATVMSRSSRFRARAAMSCWEIAVRAPCAGALPRETASTSRRERPAT